jgi:apolipoprotein N-acyltransferase
MLTRKLSIIAGIICGLSFAPVFFFPGIFMLSILCRQVHKSPTPRLAATLGYWFGFGFFLSTLYWISFGVMVYVEDFWWSIPFALFGLPAFLAIFVSIFSFILWQFRSVHLYHFLFCIFWIFNEWLISWAFTGLPWAMTGYVFSISDIFIQSASIIGILGLSFAAVFIGSAFYSKQFVSSRIVISVLIITAMFFYGNLRLNTTPTEFSEVKIRIVQPSIKQISKWDPEAFWRNLGRHIQMSQKEGDPDIIIWSEAALTAPFYYQSVYESLLSVFTRENQILITGSVNDNNKLSTEEYNIYSSLIGLSGSGNLLFEYHKSHLVPFGEYMPLKKYLPLKKLTHGIIDYTAGVRKSVYLPDIDLRLHPLICYESIFSNEVKILNTEADVIINITNDAWYGNSSGPYQHFEISRLRAVENGLPMLRAANNGISAIIDPLGRVIKKLNLNSVDIIDGHLPVKIKNPTLFTKYGCWALIVFPLIVAILQTLYLFFAKKLIRKRLFT